MQQRLQVLLAGDSRAGMWRVARWFPGLSVDNIGQVGMTSHEVLESVRLTLMHTTPEVVVVIAGINDFDVGGKIGMPVAEILRMALDNLRNIVDEVRKAGAHPVLATIPPLNGQAPAIRRARTPQEQVLALNHGIERLAADNSATVVDLARILTGSDGSLHPTCTSDGLHFNDVGYRHATAALLRRLEFLAAGLSAPPKTET